MKVGRHDNSLIYQNDIYSKNCDSRRLVKDEYSVVFYSIFYTKLYKE